MRKWLVIFPSWLVSFVGNQSSIMACVMHLVTCVVLALSILGCMARYSPEALHAMAPAAEYAEVCARPPIVARESIVFAHKMGLQKTVADDDWETFAEFAADADIIYRVDPNAHEKTMSRLPWPYQNMACRTLSARETPALPKGMKPLEISPEMREALISALMDRASLDLRAPQRDEEVAVRGPGSNKRFLGDGFFIAPYVDGRSPSERIEATGQMLRDAIRAILPKATGPKDEQISIIDTKTGQVVGGFGAGVAIGTVPGGTLIADAMLQAENVPRPTQEFVLGEKLGEMTSGAVQIGTGTVLGAGGIAASATGGGLVIGVPTCVVGVGLVANGTVTFFNGARSLIVAICNWNELPSAEQVKPMAAVAPKDAAVPAPPPQANAAPTPAAAPSPVKPAATPVQAPKPATNPAKPAAKPNTPSSGQTSGQRPRHYGSGTKSGNTTTWVRCTGQVHHAISKEIHRALERHQNLKGVYKVRDNRFVTQALDKAAHNGYQKWHIALDKEIATHIDLDQTLTPATFEAYLRQRYSEPKLKAAFPNGL